MKRKTMIPKKKVQMWIDELRSGKWEQTKFSMEHSLSYCCLGVLCKTQVPRYLKIDLGDGPVLFGDTPSKEFGAPEWIAEINHDFFCRTGKYLSELNDVDNLTFEEIADLLQAVYIEGVTA